MRRQSSSAAFPPREKCARRPQCGGGSTGHHIAPRGSPTQPPPTPTLFGTTQNSFFFLHFSHCVISLKLGNSGPVSKKDTLESQQHCIHREEEKILSVQRRVSPRSPCVICNLWQWRGDKPVHKEPSQDQLSLRCCRLVHRCTDQALFHC